MAPTLINPPKDTRADAWQRAVRTWVGGIATTAVYTASTAALAQLGAIRWTREYWASVGLLAGSAAVSGVVSYVQRHIKPPA